MGASALHARSDEPVALRILLHAQHIAVEDADRPVLHHDDPDFGECVKDVVLAGICTRSVPEAARCRTNGNSTSIAASSTAVDGAGQRPAVKPAS